MVSTLQKTKLLLSGAAPHELSRTAYPWLS